MIRTKRNFIPALLLTSSLLGAAATQASSGDKTSDDVEMLFGHAMVRAFESGLLVAVDEAGSERKPDGLVDLIFFYQMPAAPVDLADLTLDEAVLSIRTDRLTITSYQDPTEIDLVVTGKVAVDKRNRAEVSGFAHHLRSGYGLARYSPASLTMFEFASRDPASLEVAELVSPEGWEVGLLFDGLGKSGSCGAGGPGSTSCSIGNCCSVSCGTGYYACCHCTHLCRCIPNGGGPPGEDSEPTTGGPGG